jgi:hypothetical protein
LRGRIGLFARKTSQEIQHELEDWRKTIQKSLQEGTVSQHMQKTYSNHRKTKLETLKKTKAHAFGSLAKESLDKFHLKAAIYKIKEIEEILPGSHLFEAAINSPLISEYTVLAKEPSDLISISVSDYQKAIHEIRSIYKTRYKLLQKSFLIAEELPLQKISMYFVEHKYSCNEVIFNEEDNSDSLYCIASGEIQVKCFVINCLC